MARRGLQALKLKLVNFYPPFVGAGIRVTRVDLANRVIEARMKLTWWNKNYVGTHYGGSLYSICDPFYVVLLVEALGRDYVVWDKGAEIRFVRPGTGTVRVKVELSEEQVADLRAEADREGTAERVWPVRVLNEEGRTVAEVRKTVYVRRKKEKAPPSGEAAERP